MRKYMLALVAVIALLAVPIAQADKAPCVPTATTTCGPHTIWSPLAVYVDGTWWFLG
jgi:hypothetical protein